MCRAYFIFSSCVANRWRHSQAQAQVSWSHRSSAVILSLWHAVNTKRRLKVLYCHAMCLMSMSVSLTSHNGHRTLRTQASCMGTPTSQHWTTMTSLTTNSGNTWCCGQRIQLLSTWWCRHAPPALQRRTQLRNSGAECTVRASWYVALTLCCPGTARKCLHVLPCPSITMSCCSFTRFLFRLRDEIGHRSSLTLQVWHVYVSFVANIWMMEHANTF